MLLAAAMTLAMAAAMPVAAQAGELTVAAGYQFTTFDPALNTEISNSYVLTHLYSGLFRKGADGEVLGDLCERYDVSEDGLTYTFHLVSDAVWSDGVPVTAYDFEYAYLRALSYGVDNVWAINDLVNYIEGAQEYSDAALLAGNAFDCTAEDHSAVGIKAVDDTTLVLTLKAPCVYLPALMTANAWLPVREDFAPQHDFLWAFAPGYPTNGAYTLTECNEMEKAVLSKNARYRLADEVTLDTLVFLCMANEDAQAMAYRTQEIDVALGISTEVALAYQGTDELWLMPQPSNYFLLINSGSTGPAWAKDVNVRRALALAIDKQALVSVLGGDLFFPVLNGYVPEGIAGMEDTFRAEGDANGYMLTYDPDEAWALLARAGYGADNPLRIAYKYSNNGIHGSVATMLQQMWKAVGIEVTFQSVESAVFYDQLDQGDFEVIRYGYGATDNAMQYLELMTTGMQVVAAVDSPEYDRMIADARAIADPTQFNDALHAAEVYLVEENVYVIPLFNFNTPALVQSYVKGYTMAGIYPYFAHVTLAY